MKGRQCQQRPGQKEVEVETEEINHELGSFTSTSRTGSSPPRGGGGGGGGGGGPLLSHLVPPLDPAAGEQKRSAWSMIAP